jgi:hypothetical protein
MIDQPYFKRPRFASSFHHSLKTPEQSIVVDHQLNMAKNKKSPKPIVAGGQPLSGFSVNSQLAGKAQSIAIQGLVAILRHSALSLF